MKVHTTNYINTFIEIAEDSPVTEGVTPPQKGEHKSIACLQYEMLIDNPYQYTSDDILFNVFATRQEISKKDLAKAREEFFSKGQACFRASPLTKSYGWGIHSNEEGKVAMYGAETKEYRKFLADKSVKKVKAMRSKKA